mmetsp:Transcript_41102/g.116365  ORF Transcript_41102/g.116365 Transcript_41102/m.116365 type:complete len:251 (-) Transcript_41102:139-891(-)
MVVGDQRRQRLVLAVLRVVHVRRDADAAELREGGGRLVDGAHQQDVRHLPRRRAARDVHDGPRLGQRLRDALPDAAARPGHHRDRPRQPLRLGGPDEALRRDAGLAREGAGAGDAGDAGGHGLRHPQRRRLGLRRLLLGLGPQGRARVPGDRLAHLVPGLVEHHQGLPRHLQPLLSLALQLAGVGLQDQRGGLPRLVARLLELGNRAFCLLEGILAVLQCASKCDQCKHLALFVFILQCLLEGTLWGDVR